MNIMPHLKKGLNIYAKDLVVLIVSFLILPMVMSIVYGSMQKNAFDARVQPIDTIKAEFQYDESTDKGAILKSILAQDKVKELIDTSSKNAEYSVSISPDFKKAEIKGEDEGTLQFAVLKNMVGTILYNFNQYELIQSTVNNMKISEADKNALITNITSALGKNNEGLPASENIIKGYKTLSSVDYFTISMFSYSSLLMIVILAGYFYKEVKEGILRRTLSAPINKREYFLGFLLNFFIATAAISSVYVIINRIRGVAFTGNPLYLMLILLVQSLMCTSAAGFVIAFIKKEMTAMTVMNIVVIVPSMFGGVFFSSDIIDSSIMKTIANAMPNSLILNSYKGLAITGNLQSISGDVIAMAVLSIVFLALSVIKIEYKWEV